MSKKEKEVGKNQVKREKNPLPLEEELATNRGHQHRLSMGLYVDDFGFFGQGCYRMRWWPPNVHGRLNNFEFLPNPDLVKHSCHFFYCFFSFLFSFFPLFSDKNKSQMKNYIHQKGKKRNLLMDLGYLLISIVWDRELNLHLYTFLGYVNVWIMHFSMGSPAK